MRLGVTLLLTLAAGTAAAADVGIFNQGNAGSRSSSGGSGTPGGSSGQVQYNNGGSFGGIAGSAVTTAGNVSLSTLGVSNTLFNNLISQTVTTAASINVCNGSEYHLTLTNSPTITVNCTGLPSGATVNGTARLVMGANNLSAQWANVTWADGVTPTLPVTATSIIDIGFKAWGGYTSVTAYPAAGNVR